MALHGGFSMAKMGKVVDMEDDADDQHDPYEEKGKMQDIAAQGFRKIDFGPDDKQNHIIRNAYDKQAVPTESEDTNVHKIALHQQNSKFYSGPEKEKEEGEGEEDKY